MRGKYNIYIVYYYIVKSKSVMKMLIILTVLLFIVVSYSNFNSNSNAVNNINNNTSSKSVVVINLTEEIDPGSSNMFRATLENINSSYVKAVIINMNTPGGILENMLSIVNFINETEAKGISVYTYVPDDGMAASAGSYIAMASTGIYMGNGSYIGPSTPIVVGGTSLEETHTKNAMASLMESMATAHNRNETAAGIMVENNTAYTESQALKINLINGNYNSLNSLIHGKNLSGYKIIYVNESGYDQFLSFLSNSTVDGIFILLGILAIFLDFYHGSVILSVIGVVLIVLGLLGAELIDASVVGLIFLLFAAILIFLELKTQHGIALLAGMITGIIGIYFLASSYYTSNPGYSPSPFGMSFYLSAILIVILGIILILYIRKIVKSYKRKNFTGAEALMGTDGVAVNNIPKNGKGFVSLDGIKWEVINNGDNINANDTITVIGRSGIKLIIRKKDIK